MILSLSVSLWGAAFEIWNHILKLYCYKTFSLRQPQPNIVLRNRLFFEKAWNLCFMSCWSKRWGTLKIPGFCFWSKSLKLHSISYNLGLGNSGGRSKFRVGCNVIEVIPTHQVLGSSKQSDTMGQAEIDKKTHERPGWALWLTWKSWNKGKHWHSFAGRKNMSHKTLLLSKLCVFSFLFLCKSHLPQDLFLEDSILCLLSKQCTAIIAL